MAFNTVFLVNRKLKTIIWLEVDLGTSATEAHRQHG